MVSSARHRRFARSGHLTADGIGEEPFHGRDAGGSNITYEFRLGSGDVSNADGPRAPTTISRPSRDALSRRRLTGGPSTGIRRTPIFGELAQSFISEHQPVCRSPAVQAPWQAGSGYDPQRISFIRGIGKGYGGSDGASPHDFNQADRRRRVTCYGLDALPQIPIKRAPWHRRIAVTV